MRLPALPAVLPAAFLSTAVFAETRIPFLPFWWPFFPAALAATFLGFSDLDLFLARLGMGAYLPRPSPRGKVLRARIYVIFVTVGRVGQRTHKDGVRSTAVGVICDRSV